MSHLDEGQLHALLDGEVEPSERVALESHLSSCSECARLLEESRAFMAEADDLVRAVDLPEPSASPVRVERPLPPPTPRAAVKPPAAPRLVVYRRLGWAASLVLAAGLGYVANDLSRVSTEPSVSAVRSAERAQPGAAAPESAGASALDSVADESHPAEEEGGGAELAMKAAPTPSAETARARLERPAQRSTRQEGPTTPGLRDRRSDSARVSARVQVESEPLRPRDVAKSAAREAPPPAAGEFGAAAAQLDTPAPASAVRRLPADRVAAVHAVPHGLAPSPTAVSIDGFLVITMDQAVRRLSGTIRLIDGMTPDRVQAGPGRLVPGADTAREVIRVVYLDPPGRELWLDQQRRPRSEARVQEADRTAPALLVGDTVVTSPDGGLVRVTWLDPAGFWMSLSGQVSQDSLRSLIRQIR